MDAVTALAVTGAVLSVSWAIVGAVRARRRAVDQLRRELLTMQEALDAARLARAEAYGNGFAAGKRAELLRLDREIRAMLV
jgi:hypothetical protein